MTTQRSASGSVLAAIVTALNVSTLTACVSGQTVTIANDIPQPAPVPYVEARIGTETRDDAMQQPGKTVMVLVEIYSDHEGDSQINTINDVVVRLLHYATLSITHHTLVSIQYEDGQWMPIEDIAAKKRRRWISTFRVDVRQA